MSTSQALVKDLEGEVSVTRNGEVVNIKVGDYLLPGDEVVTGDSGRLGLEFPGIMGQEPAAGVMTPNGKIVLGEQDSPNGPQMLVMEETECFEFTTELTEMSSVAQDTGAAGLFGGLAGSGGLLTSAIGALATGLFVGGSSDDNDNKDPDIPAPSNDGGFGVSGGESLPAALAPVVAEDSPVGEAVTAAVGPSTPVGQALAPAATPLADVINEVVNTVNNSPLGVVTKPVTDVALGLIPAVLGGSTGGSAGGSDTDTSTIPGSNSGSNSGSNPGSNAGGAPSAEAGPISTVVDTVVEGAVGGINQTPLGEPLSPVTTTVQTLADTFDLNSLINIGNEIGSGEGLVTTVVDTVGDVIEPVTAQVEPLATVVDTLHDTAVTVDSLLADTLGAVEGVFGGADILGAGAGGLSPDSLSLESLSLESIPQTLEEATGGLLGTVESLTAQLQSGGVEDPTGGLLDTVVSTISSTAADPGSSDLSSALSKVLGGLG